MVWIQLLKYRCFGKIRQISILNYLSYDKKKAIEVLNKEVGWEFYGEKHYESVFTRFYQGYILPKKFGIDKRRLYFSTLICSGQISRKEALKLMKERPYKDSLLLQKDKKYILSKLGFTEGEFEKYLFSPSVSHTFYSSSEWIYKLLRKLRNGIAPNRGLQEEYVLLGV